MIGVSGFENEIIYLSGHLEINKRIELGLAGGSRELAAATVRTTSRVATYE